MATQRIDDSELTLPAASWLPVDDRLIPSGPPQDVAGTEFDFRVPRKLASTVLDHAFTRLSRDADGLAWVHVEGGGAAHRHVDGRELRLAAGVHQRPAGA